MSEISRQVGQQIRQLRMQRQMSQEELSFKAGLSPAHLGQIERAVKNPTIDTVAKIAGALDVPVAELFATVSASEPAQSPFTEKILAQLAAMEEEDQKDILRIIRIFRGYQQRVGFLDEDESARVEK